MALSSIRCSLSLNRLSQKWGSLQTIIIATEERTGPFRFKPGFKPRALATTATIGEGQYNVSHRHQEIQQALYQHLVSLPDSGEVGTENDGVDVWFVEE